MNRLPILKDYNADSHNILLPTTDMELAPYHQVVIQQAQLSTAKDDGDVYPLRVKGGQVELYAIARRGLDRLVSAAGGRWSPTALERDDDRVTAQVHLALLAPDGQWQVWTGSYTWDIAERQESARQACERDLERPPSWAKDIERWRRDRLHNLDNELLLIRRHATSRAETGAMLRAARKALGIKPGYTSAEIARPFVVARISVNIFELPMFAQAAVSAWMGQQLAPFGGPAMPHLAHPFRPRLSAPREEWIDPMSDEAREQEKAMDAAEPEPDSPPESSEPQPQPTQQPATPKAQQATDNGKRQDPMTTFWTQARARGISLEDGRGLLAKAGGDAAKARALLAAEVNP